VVDSTKRPKREDMEILDRVGGGDSFCQRLVYGLLKFNDPQKAVEYGAAHGALAMTTPGDTSMASLKEGRSAGQAQRRVQRGVLRTFAEALGCESPKSVLAHHLE